ncbi:hypothetical protein CHUAL_013254 [Chamberlinius hualienensis]
MLDNIFLLSVPSAFVLITARLCHLIFLDYMFYERYPWSERRFLKTDVHSTVWLCLIVTVAILTITESRTTDIWWFYAFMFVGILFKNKIFKETHVSGSVFNVGRAAAINYVDNYLKNVIPSLTSGLRDHKGLTARIDKFEREENSKRFPDDPNINQDSVPFSDETRVVCQKYLYILIPKSGNNDFGLLSDVDNKLKYMGDLPNVELDIEGHTRRSYPNSVYCFDEKVDKCFVAEFATPLSSLYQISQEVDEGLIPNQIEAFYEALKRYLKEELHPYEDLVKLIYYDGLFKTM